MTHPDSSWHASLSDMSDFPTPHALHLSLDIQTGPDFFADSTSLTTSVLGETVPQGSLFAYLFRRFGFPNAGSDNYKELATYRLSTPRDDMVLRITPYAQGDPDISFSFLAPAQICTAARDWPYRHRAAHEARFRDFIDALPAPGWAENWIAQCLQDPVLMPPSRGELTLSGTLTALMMLKRRLERDGGEDPRVAWLDRQEEIFNSRDPRPDAEWRTADWHSWPDEDPLKPYALAAEHTLRDLQVPIFIRDCAIDIYGPVEAPGPDAIATPARSAGYPGGQLSNVDPDAFARIHRAVLDLGNGDPVQGMGKALSLLSPDET